jgi:hypothetical protein
MRTMAGGRYRGRSHGWWGAAIVLVVILVVVSGCGGGSLIGGGGGCSDATRVVIAEFPAYGNVELDIGDGAEGGCFASFTAPDASARVLAYYRRQLEHHGWQTSISGVAPATGGEVPSSIPLSSPSQGSTTLVGIAGRRDGYSYEVSTEPGESASGVSVGINVVGPND